MRKRHRFVARHRDDERDGHDSRMTKFMMLNGVRFGPRTSGVFVSLWRQGLPGEVIVDTGPICAESGGKEQFLQGHAENIQA